MTAGFRASWIRNAVIGFALLVFFPSAPLAKAHRISISVHAEQIVRMFHANRPAGKIFAAAEISNTPAAAKELLAQNSQPPLEPGTKRQARFLGALGLVIISVLVLATGIALLRSFRQR